MRENTFSFTPAFKITAAGQSSTELSSMDPAIKRRFRMMPMDFVPKVADRKLEQTLQAEGAGYWWMINGLCDPSGLELSRLLILTSRPVTDEYVAEQDILARWLAERPEKGGSAASEPLLGTGLYRNAQGSRLTCTQCVQFRQGTGTKGMTRLTMTARGFRNI
jgi:phage/plasmid-associated DNA primase